MRKLELVTVEWFLLAFLVLSHRTPRTGVAAEVTTNGKTPIMPGSDTIDGTSHGDAITGSESPDTTGGEDRVLSFGIRLDRSEGETLLVLGDIQSPAIPGDGSAKLVDNRDIAQDVLIAYKPAP
jgi:hypothetical protein